MIRYDEALARIHETIEPLPVVERAPLRLLGCHLAVPLVAPCPLPAADDSAMDGFAIRAGEVAGASREAPVPLAIGRGAAAIATGDPLPSWADAVVPIELCRVIGERVEVFKAVPRGANVRRRGEDVEAGAPVAPAGARIDAAIVLAAASLGIERLAAHRRVRASVLAVGHHLAQGRPDATGPAVVATLRGLGAIARGQPPCAGDAAEVAERIAAVVRRVDLLVTTGSVSVGADDVVPAALERLGCRVVFHGVSIKPGKPIGLAIHEGRPILLLPGSPAAALAGFDGIGRQLLARLAGDRAGLAPVRAMAGREIVRRRGKTGLVRGTLATSGANLIFEAQPKQGPAQISAVVGTNALAVIPPDVERIDAGAELEVLPLGAIPQAQKGRVVAVCGWSGAGKTYVVAGLIRTLTARGLRVATVKHDAHGFDPDPAGKDTAIHRDAGAIATALVAPQRTAVVREEAVTLAQLAADHLARGADLVIAEGFKHEPGVPKIEVIARGREPVGASPLLAIVTDRDLPSPSAPTFSPDDRGLEALASLLLG